ERVRVGGPDRVRGRVPVRVALEGELGVTNVRLDLVRTGRDERGVVLLLGVLRLRNRRGLGEGEQERELRGRLRQVELDRLVVRGLHTRDLEVAAVGALVGARRVERRLQVGRALGAEVGEGTG